MTYSHGFKIGDHIKFDGEKRPYVIRACDDNFIIATKPFLLHRTFWITVVDLKEATCGHFGGNVLKVDEHDQAELALAKLNSGALELLMSSRSYLSDRELEMLGLA